MQKEDESEQKKGGRYKERKRGMIRKGEGYKSRAEQGGVRGGVPTQNIGWEKCRRRVATT